MDVDLQLFKNIMAEGRNNTDLLDSFSPNQFKSKENLITHINNLGILDDKSEIVILGGWYGSILLPAFTIASPSAPSSTLLCLTLKLPFTFIGFTYLPLNVLK